MGLLALLILIPAIWTHREKIRAASRSDWLKGLAGPLFMLLAIGLWLVPMLLAVAQSGDPVLQAYRDNILLRQTVTRHANAWHHVKPFWYYTTSVILPFWLPVSPAALAGGGVAQGHPGAGQAHHPAARLPGAGDRLLLGVAGQRRLCHAGHAGAGLLTAPFVAELLARVWPARLLGGSGWLLGIICLAGGALAFSAKLASKLGIWARRPGCPCWRWGGVAAAQRLAAPGTAHSHLLLAGGGLADLLQLDLREAQRHAHPGGGDGAGGAAGARGRRAVAGRLQGAAPAVRSTTRAPLSLPAGDGEQAREGGGLGGGQARRHVLGSADIMTVCFDAVRMTNLGNRHRTDWLLAGADALKPECRGLSPQIEPFSYTPGPEPGQQTDKSDKQRAAIGSPLHRQISRRGQTW